MNYHIEHHMFPMVPFHALPRLHERVEDVLPHTYSGLVEAFREIVPTLIKQSKDAKYFVLRELPQKTRSEPAPAIAVSGETHYA
jgi:fatty acid desaturase